MVGDLGSPIIDDPTLGLMHGTVLTPVRTDWPRASQARPTALGILYLLVASETDRFCELSRSDDHRHLVQDQRPGGDVLGCHEVTAEHIIPLDLDRGLRYITYRITHEDCN